MKGKIKSFFVRNGIYLLLLVCVAAVFAAGVSILSDQGDDDVPVVAYPTDTVSQSTASRKPTATPAPTPSSTNDGNAFHEVTPTPNADATTTPDTTPSKISMIKPLEGDIQTDYSGKKLVYNKTTKEWRTHSATDIAGTDGAEVKAAADGTVSAVKADPRYGQTVVIDHGNGLSTVYSGFGNVTVKEGAAVKKGDSLGTLGGEIFCEREQGLHLHFEVILNGTSVNPNDYWS